MEQNFFNIYSKEFVIETSQIQEWLNYLMQIKSQANVLRESTQCETSIFETLGKNLLTVVKSYYNNVQIYSDEPSQLYAITKIYCNIFEFTGKSLTQDSLMINIHVNKHLSNMILEVDKLTKSIMQNSSFYMDELINVKKTYNTIQARYLKLKAEIEEAHLAKKKIEVDPKLIYNISLKDKAEQKILTLLKDMQIILPDLENISKEVDNKKTAFNKLMKESFELIVGCVFKNHVRIRETFFLLSKEKEDIFTRIKDIANLKFAQIRETNFQLNDFVERKYAELKNIYYDSIETIIINEDDYFLANSLLSISDTLINYSENFYNLMKKRKRILKEFHKFFVLLYKSLELNINMYSKAIKQIQSAVTSFKDLCQGTKKTWDSVLYQLSENYNSYSALTKNLINSANNYIMKIANEIKSEYVRFLDKWSKYSKQINSMKPQLVKIQTNKSKIVLQMNELRSSLTNIVNLGYGGQMQSEKNNAKIETRISQLKEEENSIRESSNITCRKYKEIIVQSIEFLKATVKPMRENEGKKLNGFSEILENFGNMFKNIIEKNLDLLSNQTEMSVNTDIYEEVKDIFNNYLEKYCITEKFFELIIKKIIKNSNFNSDDYARDKINSYLTQKERGSVSPFSGQLNSVPNLGSAEYLNQVDANCGNFGNKREFGAAYENAFNQNLLNSNLNTPNVNYSPKTKNYLSGSTNIKNFFTNNNNFNNNLMQSQNNLNQSSFSYSAVNLNLNVSGNEDFLSSPEQHRKRNSVITRNNNNNNGMNNTNNNFINNNNYNDYDEPISANRFSLKETCFFGDPMDSNNIERLNRESSLNISGNKLAGSLNPQEWKSSNNPALTSSAKEQNKNNIICTLVKNNISRDRNASFEKMNFNLENNLNDMNIKEINSNSVPFLEASSIAYKQRNITFNRDKTQKETKSNNLSNNHAKILDDLEKSDFESINQKSPNLNFLNHQNIQQNQLIADENRNFNNYYGENDNSSSSVIETLGSLEEEKMNFINLENFKVISNNGYENIKENEIKEYMEKLNALGGKSPDKVKIKKLGKDPKAGNFILEKDETLIDSYSCAYADKILMQGKLYVTSQKVAFRSMFNNKTLFGTTKLIIPIEDIERVEKKSHLKIFDNSVEIVTKKSKLFFTSFVSRDQCFKTISQLVEDYKKKNKKENDDENNENEENENDNNLNKHSKHYNLRKSNLSFGSKVLKKIDFFKRLDYLHKQNLTKFEQAGNSFKPFDFYKNVYYDNDPIGNVSMPLIFNYIYNPDVICEELNCNKTFLESLFILRKDYEMSFEPGANQVPKFYSDLDYVMNKLSNLEEENLNEFLDDVPDWGLEPYKFNYKFVHPIKKKMFGPEKINLSTDFYIYFVSPKMFIVEEHGNSTGFTYCDYFVSMLQYRFYCDYKYDSKENCFKFATSVSIGFQINFLKSCMFKNMIETEGAKESEESIRFNIMEKMQQVFEGQAPIFNEYFKKMTDENNNRLASNYANNNLIEGENNNENEEENNNNDNLVNEINSNVENINNEENKEEKFGIVNNDKKDYSNIEMVKILNFEVERKLLVMILMYVFLVLFIFYNLKVIFIDREFSFDKFVNTMLLIAIFFIFNAINK